MTKLSYTPNYCEFKGRTYYVAQRHPKAADANPGTKALPFRTVTKAASLIEMGAMVVIDAGVYREEIPLLKKAPPYAYFGIPIFCAAPGKKVWIRGSDVFAPDWQPVTKGVYRAPLPEALFGEGAYNPYRLSGAVDDPGAVRPCAGPLLPETLGQLYIHDQPLAQLTSESAVLATPGSFAVLADGRDVLVHFTSRTPPRDGVELTVRQRCFKPLYEGIVVLQTVGLDIRHAAEPGPFCRCRSLTIRRNPGTGIVVRKTGPVFDGDQRTVSDMNFAAYVSATSPVMRAVFAETVGGNLFAPPRVYMAESDDGGCHWRPVSQPTETDPQAGGAYFLDAAKDTLIRVYLRRDDGLGGCGKMGHDVMAQYSRDGARTWTAPEVLDHGAYYHRLIVLRNGELLWPYQIADCATHRHKCGVMIGTWRNDLSGINWQRGPLLEVPPEQSYSGPCEMNLCQFPDGRVFAIMRQQGVGVTRGNIQGLPSVKFVSVSADNGRTWSALQPLTDDAGHFVYSSASWPGAIMSSKTGKAYVLLNISDQPVMMCDPRVTVHIAEVDPERLCLMRKTLAVVETRHPEHHPYVRFSNWSIVEERGAGRWMLFMKLHMNEYCPLRMGYDFSTYRYEIELPN